MKDKSRYVGLLACAALLAMPLDAMAQSGTNSPYSQYGLGVLSDQSQGQGRGMGGVGIGLRSGNSTNSLNPASYSAVDSLSMIIDAAVSGQITNFKEGGKRVNANNADFEYIVASFRLMPRLGLGVGILPYTNIGYSYSHETPIEGSSLSSTESYSGDGGIHQAYVGVGYLIYKGISVGANFSYLWGSYDKTVSIASSESSASSMTRTYSATVTNYKLDFGVQWEHLWNKTDRVVIGAVYGLGHNIGGDPEMSTTVSSTTTMYAPKGLSIPHSLGVGASWQRSNGLLFALDYTWQKWGSLEYPVADNDAATYSMSSSLLQDRHKIALGAEWTPNEMSRSLLKRIHYRVGASMNNAYFKVNGQDGPKEYAVTAGLGIPITNSWNNRSTLNVSAQWTHGSASGLITENTFRINIGLTFNERWFMKWKVE